MIYPGVARLDSNEASCLKERMSLTAKNGFASFINDVLLEKFSTEMAKYTSIDCGKVDRVSPDCTVIRDSFFT